MFLRFLFTRPHVCVYVYIYIRMKITCVCIYKNRYTHSIYQSSSLTIYIYVYMHRHVSYNPFVGPVALRVGPCIPGSPAPSPVGSPCGCPSNPPQRPDRSRSVAGRDFGCQDFGAVNELKLRYHSPQTILSTLYIYIHTHIMVT